MRKFIFFSLCLGLMACGHRSGSTGVNGKNGVDGYSLVVDVVTMVSANGVICKRTDIFQDLDRNNFYSTGDTYQNGFLVCDGQVGAKGDTGEQGVAGLDGQDGTNGHDGLNGHNGTNGTNGLNADTTYQVIEIIDPCGAQQAQGFDEVILKLGNGKYLASFSDNANGKNTRFGLLPHGNYQTTDGTNCNFTI